MCCGYFSLYTRKGCVHSKWVEHKLRSYKDIRMWYEVLFWFKDELLKYIVYTM